MTKVFCVFYRGALAKFAQKVDVSEIPGEEKDEQKAADVVFRAVSDQAHSADRIYVCPLDQVTMFEVEGELTPKEKSLSGTRSPEA